MSLATKIPQGLASLFRRKKPKVNRRLTPEEIAERRLREAEGDPTVRALMGHKYGGDPTVPIKIGKKKQNVSVRALMGYKHGISPKHEEALAMAKQSLGKMDLPASTKRAAFDEIQSYLLNRVPPAVFESVPTAQIVKGVLKKMGFPIGAGLGFIGGAEMEGLAREGKLPNWMTQPEFRNEEDAIKEALGATGMGGGMGAAFGPSGTTPYYEEPEFDLALDEEPLEQGGIGDLLLWNRIFGN
jgi:hypothetical protein